MIIGIFVCIIGAIYLGYSYFYRHTVTVYHRNQKFVIINSEKYFMLQFYFAILNSTQMIIIGIIATLINLQFYVFSSVLLLHFINYLFKVVARRKGYIQYEQ